MRRFPSDRAAPIIERFVTELEGVLGVTWQGNGLVVTGAYRRGSATIDEVPVVVRGDNGADALRDWLTQAHWEGKLHLRDTESAVAADLPVLLPLVAWRFVEPVMGLPFQVYLAPPEAFAYLVLYTTGPLKWWLRLHRDLAARRYKLTPCGIETPQGKHWRINRETDIFRRLKMRFVKPDRRS